MSIFRYWSHFYDVVPVKFASLQNMDYLFIHDRFTENSHVRLGYCSDFDDVVPVRFASLQSVGCLSSRAQEHLGHHGMISLVF